VCGWANLRSHLAIPFNQNQKNLCMVGLTWDPIWRSPLTRTIIVCVVSLWRVTCPNGKRKEWSHYYGWPTRGGEWPHYYGWPTQVKKWRMVSLYGRPTQVKKIKNGLIVWVTYPGKMMVSLYGWRTQEKWWSHCMGDEPKKIDGLIVWVTNPRKMMVSLYGWLTQEK